MLLRKRRNRVLNVSVKKTDDIVKNLREDFENISKKELNVEKKIEVDKGGFFKQRKMSQTKQSQYKRHKPCPLHNTRITAPPPPVEEEEEEKNEYVDGKIALKHIYERLQSWEPSTLLCRDNEYKKIYSFLTNAIHATKGDCLYICGSPGTGKSLTVEKICRTMKSVYTNQPCAIRPTFVRVNAMSLSQPQHIYQLIASGIISEKARVPERFNCIAPFARRNYIECSDALDDVFLCSPNEKYGKIVVIIDEMDGLLNSASDEKVLYRLFEWSKKEYSRLVLIGIANRVDLTERFLPRLSQQGTEAELLIFSAYSQDQLLNIMIQRVTFYINNDEYNLFDNRALELCARRLASKSGDVRACLDLCKACLQYIEDSINNMTQIQLLDRMKSPVKCITISRMGQLLHDRFGSHTVDVIQGLPTSQKTLLLAIFIVIIRRPKKKPLSLQIFQKFLSMLTQELCLPQVGSEIHDILDELNGMGLIRVKNNSRGRKINDNNIITINIRESEVEYAFENDTFFSNTLTKGKELNSRLFL